LNKITDVIDGKIRRFGPMVSVEAKQTGVLLPGMTAVIVIFRVELFFGVFVIHVRIHVLIRLVFIDTINHISIIFRDAVQNKKKQELTRFASKYHFWERFPTQDGLDVL
jgi:hypothetical protein